MTSLSLTITAFCVLAALESASGAEAPAIRLTGMVDVEGQRQAILEITPSARRAVIKPILSEGERVESVELRRIDSKFGRVELLVDGSETFQVLDGGQETAWVPSLHFKGADLRQVLEVYQQLCGRTVLYPDALPGLKFDLKTGTLSRAAAVAELEAQFRAKGLELKPRGTKFVFIVQGHHADRLASIPDSAFARTDNSEVLPAGLIKFSSADVFQVLEIYQELTGRTVLRPSDLRGKISVRTQTPLTRDEAIWVMESVLALAHLETGLMVQPRSTNVVFVVPGNLAGRLAAIRDISPVPELNSEVLPAGLLKFQDAAPLQVLEVYQELSGRTVLRGQDMAGRIVVRTQTPLTRGEAQWVLEAVLALADIAIVPEGDKFVFAVKGIENPRVPTFEKKRVTGTQAEEPVRPPLKFADTSVTNALALYGKLLGREPLPLETTPAIRMSLRAQQALTPSETLFALDALAALNRCRFDLVGDNQVRIVPAALPRPNDPLAPNPK